MPTTAEDWLDPAKPDKPAWAVFDAAWYLNRYPDARAACAGGEAAALAFYLKTGVLSGHSPSPLFDEVYYLTQNPDVLELVRGGKYQSGFDHFCQHGHRVLSPHWLFNDQLYGRLYEDMSLENLDQHGLAGRYDHYLRSGQRENRTGHFLFDPAFYRRQAVAAGVEEAELEAAGPFTQFLYRLQAGLPELRPSIYFEPGWYRENGIGVRVEIGSGVYRSALEHYLCNDTPEMRDPVPQFSEAFYREAYRDVRHAIDNGYFRNGYLHYIQFGAFELRRPNHEIDLGYYRKVNPRVRDDLNSGAVRDAFAHLRLIGLAEGLAYTPPEAMSQVAEPVAKQMFLRRARNGLAVFAHRRLDFAAKTPAIAVVMVLFNKFELTMHALASLRDNFAGEIELILVDNGSSDDTRRIADYVTGARILREPENIGFLRAANLGLAEVSAPAVLFLNNDVELGHAAIAAALARLDSAADIGAVGAKIIRSHGMLQEAGSIIWRDGTASGYLRDASPAVGEANFVRDVDFCSGVFLLCRAALVKTLGGFSDVFAPAYYEDADLCLRIAGAGFRVVYDPAVCVHHLEFGSAVNAESSAALMRRGLKIFSQRHADYLARKYEKMPGHEVFARGVPRGRRRVLFLEDTVPLRRLGSGFVRANDAVHAIAAAGYEVTVFPINGAAYDLMSIFGDMPEGVEVMHDRDITLLPEFLAERAGYYDLVWISRTHNLGRVRPVFEAAGMAALPMVLDTEAVVTIRDATRAAFGEVQRDFNFNAGLRAEFAGAETCRQITAVNRIEVDLLHSIGLPSVSMLGTIRAPAATPAGFDERAGLLFVAAIHQADSPNLDALHWYADDILPALTAEMEEPPVLHVVGYTAPEIDLSRFAGNPFIKIHGPVGDLAPFYNAARVFVAPTRFAAGTPYKLYETASFGLPCVAGDLLARQLGWAPGQDLLAPPLGDGKIFASQIALLYRTETLWTRLRENALARIAAENSAARFNAAVAEVLQKACAEPAAPAPVSPVARQRRAARKPVAVG